MLEKVFFQIRISSENKHHSIKIYSSGFFVPAFSRYLYFLDWYKHFVLKVPDDFVNPHLDFVMLVNVSENPLAINFQEKILYSESICVLTQLKFLTSR